MKIASIDNAARMKGNFAQKYSATSDLTTYFYE